MGESIKSVVTPVHLEYDYSAGTATSRFLRGLAKKKIVGGECPSCQRVYVPPRGSCPRCAVPTAREVAVSDHGTVVTFSIVRVPSVSTPLSPTVWIFTDFFDAARRSGTMGSLGMTLCAPARSSSAAFRSDARGTSATTPPVHMRG